MSWSRVTKSSKGKYTHKRVTQALKAYFIKAKQRLWKIPAEEKRIPRIRTKVIRLVSPSHPRDAVVTKLLLKKNKILITIDDLLKHLLDRVEMLTESMNQTKKHEQNGWYDEKNQEKSSSCYQ